MLGPADVGHRVVVRRRAGETTFADVLGHLVELTESEITVQGRVDRVRIPRHEVVTAKRIPDRRRLTATERLEIVAAEGWPAPDRSTLGRWLLRAAAGWTARGNSALAVGDPDRPLPAAVEAVTHWYTARDLPPRIALADPVGGRLGALLTDLGWTASPRTEVRTRSLSAVVRPVSGVPVEPVPRPEWFTAVGAHKGGLPTVAKQILTGVPVTGFAGVYADDAARAVGRGVVTGGWLGISLVSVDPVHRRQGLARTIMDALTAWGQAAGATRAYLQVEAHNSAAVAMYDRLGFTVHHTYATWTAPGQPAR